MARLRVGPETVDVSQMTCHVLKCTRLFMIGEGSVEDVT